MRPRAESGSMVMLWWRRPADGWVFRMTTGVTPLEFASAVRGDRFLAGLEAGLSVTEAVYEAGYSPCAGGGLCGQSRGLNEYRHLYPRRIIVILWFRRLI